MTTSTAKWIAFSLLLAVTLGAVPAIGARARTDSGPDNSTGRMTGGCDEMMNGATADTGMMSGRQSGGGMMGGGMMGGGERPNQQWRR